MPVKIEARRLSGADIGKTVSVQYLGSLITGTLYALEAVATEIDLWIRHDEKFPDDHLVLEPTDTLTITGKPS